MTIRSKSCDKISKYLR